MGGLDALCWPPRFARGGRGDRGGGEMAAAAAAVASAVRKVGDSRSVATAEEISDVELGVMWVAAAVYPMSPADWEKFGE